MSPSKPQDVEAALHAALPASLTIATGDAIELDWYNARAAIPRTRVFPHGTFRIRPEAQQGGPPKHFGTRTANASATDVITFASGTLDYLLAQRDAASITSITGTLAGNAHTFVSGTDYSLVGSDPEDDFLDTVSWLQAGDKPDDTTQFTVIYAHRRWEDILVGRSTIPFMLTLHVKPLASGLLGATQAYDHTTLGPMLGRALQDTLAFSRNKHIASTADSKLQWGPVGPLQVRADEEDETLSRWAVEATLSERQLFARDALGRVRQVEHTVSANVG